MLSQVFYSYYKNIPSNVESTTIETKDYYLLKIDGDF